MSGPISAPNVAIIFESGGTRNSYNAPCVTELIHRQVQPGWVGGISAGATHLSNFLSHDAARSERSFTTVPADPRFGGWKHFARGRGFFNAEFVFQISPLPGEIAEFDYETFDRDPTDFGIAATHALTGETVYWERDDVKSMQDLMAYVRASSTMPFLMPVATVNDEPYYDGALGTTGGFAYDRAQEHGFDRFIFVMSRPYDFERQPPSSPRFVRRTFRKYPAIAEAIITRHERYNASRAQIKQWEREGKALVFWPEDLTVSNHEVNPKKLELSYLKGQQQMQCEWPRWEEFLRDPASGGAE